MKHLRSILKALFVVVFTFTATRSHAQIVEDSALQQMDSVQISLLWSYGYQSLRSATRSRHCHKLWYVQLQTALFCAAFCIWTNRL